MSRRRRRKHRGEKNRQENPGVIAEREFVEDLYELLRSNRIRDVQRNKMLDQRGVDALVTRRDGVHIKINVLVNTLRALRHHQVLNRHLAKKDPMRKNILLWRHDRTIDCPTRMRALLRAIEEHDPDT